MQSAAFPKTIGWIVSRTTHLRYQFDIGGAAIMHEPTAVSAPRHAL